MLQRLHENERKKHSAREKRQEGGGGFKTFLPRCSFRDLQFSLTPSFVRLHQPRTWKKLVLLAWLPIKSYYELAALKRKLIVTPTSAPVKPCGPGGPWGPITPYNKNNSCTNCFFPLNFSRPSLPLAEEKTTHNNTSYKSIDVGTTLSKVVGDNTSDIVINSNVGSFRLLFHNLFLQ